MSIYRIAQNLMPGYILKWTLDCGHVIICDCDGHYTGQSVYCSKCNEWKILRIWSRYVPASASSD